MHTGILGARIKKMIFAHARVYCSEDVMTSQDMFVDEPLNKLTSVAVLNDLVSARDLPEDYYFDWVKIIMQLEREGQNMPKISKRTGIPECRIKGWKLQGYRVRLEDGLPVIKLWLAVTRKKVHELPIVYRYDPKAVISGA